MKNFQLISFLIVLQLTTALSYSSQEQVESVSTACSKPTDCKTYLAQNNSPQSAVGTTETKSIEAVSEKVESLSNPLGKASESIESISKPIETLSKPLDSASEPLGSVSKPPGSVSKPVDSYLPPGDSLNESQESPPKIKGGKVESVGSGPNSVEGGEVDVGKEPSAIEERSDSSASEENFDELFRGGGSADLKEQRYGRINGTKEAYCKWTDENGMIHIESGEKCIGK